MNTDKLTSPTDKIKFFCWKRHVEVVSTPNKTKQTTPPEIGEVNSEMLERFREDRVCGKQGPHSGCGYVLCLVCVMVAGLFTLPWFIQLHVCGFWYQLLGISALQLITIYFKAARWTQIIFSSPGIKLASAHFLSRTMTSWESPSRHSKL